MEIYELVPEYYRKFVCVGDKCEDTCCKGWHILLDKRTYKNYKNVSNKHMKNLLSRNIERCKGDSAEKAYGIIKLNKDNMCPFLDEKGLCSVYTELGEHYLSNTCSIYPRITNRVNNIIERSLILSCPEAARLALLDADKMEFQQTQISSEDLLLTVNTIDTNSEAAKLNGMKYFWELRIASIAILQNRNYFFEDRIFILGIMLNKIQQLINSNNIEEIPEIIRIFETRINNREFDSFISEINTSHKDIFIKAIFGIIDIRLEKGINSNVFINCLNESSAGLHIEKNELTQEMLNNYSNAKINYFDTFLAEKAYIFENYLVNCMFRSLFPFSMNMGVFSSYQHLVIVYSLLKFVSVGLSASYKQLSDELIIKLIYSYERAFEHDQSFLNEMLEFLEKNGINNLAYMGILVKS